MSLKAYLFTPQLALLNPERLEVAPLTGVVLGALLQPVLSAKHLLLLHAVLFGATLVNPYLSDEEKVVVGGSSLLQDFGMWLGYGLVYMGRRLRKRA